MKNNKVKNISVTALLFLVVYALTPAASIAQVQSSAYQPLITQYVENDAATRKASWWNLLGRQLSYSIDRPYNEVSVAELQNIIFFASNYKDQVKLKDAIPSLLSIFKNHENEQVRIMAVSAIHSIGDRDSLLELKEAVELETSPRVKRIAYAAINKYYAK